MDLAALERLEKKFQYTYNGRNAVSTLAPSLFNGSSPYLQVKRTTIKARMRLNHRHIPPLTKELAALERLENRCIIL